MAKAKKASSGSSAGGAKRGRGRPPKAGGAAKPAADKHDESGEEQEVRTEKKMKCLA